ncbi:MAG: PH domain-containing protein [Candidatus Levybacteria bacterium]|nr:PH domain-containing protein [Candidatus Levybacteria bacterium]
MAQIENRGEKIHVTHINIRQSIFFLVLKLILLDILAAFLSILYFSSVSNKFLPEVINNTILSYNLSFFLILIFAKVILTIYIVMLWINEYYEVWPNNLIHRSGFILKKEEKHPFSQMRSVKIEQGFFGKIFGFGTISLYNWYLKTYAALYLIHNPIKYFHIIEGLVPKTEKEKEVFLDNTTAGQP